MGKCVRPWPGSGAISTSACPPCCVARRPPVRAARDVSLGVYSSPLAMPIRRFGEPQCGGSAPRQALWGMRVSMAKWRLGLYITSAYLPGCDADGRPSAIRQTLRRWASLAIRRRLVDEFRNAEEARRGQALWGMRVSMAKWCLGLYRQTFAHRAAHQTATRPRCARTFCWGVTVRRLLCR